MSGERTPYFDISYTADELMRLDDTDFDQLEALKGEPEGTALWWHIRREMWAEQDQDQAD